MKKIIHPFKYFTLLIISLFGGIGVASAQTGGAIWEAGPVMNHTRIFPFVARLDDGRNIAFGGREYGFISSWYADAYDPISNSFTNYDMLMPHDGAAFTRLQDGRYLLIGGSDSWGIAPGYAEAEIFNPADNSFTFTGSMTMGRMQHTAATLADGRVLVVGGWYNDAGATYPEVFNPETGTFSATGTALNSPRASAIVFPANDGGAVVLGGWPSYSGSVFTQVEYFDPTTGNFSVLQDELIPTDPGWLAYYGTEYRPQEERVMYNGSYVFRAYRYDPYIEYALITFDPETKAFSKIDIDASLTNSPLIDYFYDMVLNEAGTMAYLLGVSTDVDPYALYLVSVDLTTGDVYMPEEAYYLPGGEYVMGTLSWVSETEQILFIGISASPSDYFNATDKTYLLTPEINPVELDELANVDDLLMIYPNPCSNNLYVQLMMEGNWDIVLTDMNGRLVLQADGFLDGGLAEELDVSSLAQGVYILQVRQNDLLFTRQLVISE